MIRTLFAIAVLFLTTSSVLAATIPQPGDFYLISRDLQGTFVGSHKIYGENSAGLKQATYCSRSYFVRAKTVAWTQLETERGNTVQIEFNFGKGWRPICSHPEDQVTLKDIGILRSAQEVMAGIEEDEKSAKGRLSAIRQVFNSSKGDSARGSYHSR